MARIRNKRNKTFRELSENEKDEVINWIVLTGNSVVSATLKFDLSIFCINKIFKTRYKKSVNQK